MKMLRLKLHEYFERKCVKNMRYVVSLNKCPLWYKFYSKMESILRIK